MIIAFAMLVTSVQTRGPTMKIGAGFAFGLKGRPRIVA